MTGIVVRISDNEFLHAPNKTTRSRDIIERVVASGAPLPLEVMLSNMAAFYSEALRVESAIEQDGSIDPHFREVAKAYRAAAQKCAVDAAPFCHPKVASIGQDQLTAPERRERSRTARLVEAWKSKSTDELRRAYQDLVVGRGDDADAVTVDDDDSCDED